MPKVRLKKQSKIPDTQLLLLAIALTIFGLVAVADASAPIALNSFSDKFYFVKQQAIWGFIGIVALIVVSKIKYTFWQKIALPFFIITLVLLTVVLFPGASSRILGARRWLDLGLFSFQPSELVKLSLAVYLAKVASKDKQVLAFLLPIGIVLGLIMFEPDLGTALVIGAVGLTQAFIAGINIVYLGAAMVASAVAGIILIITSDYRRDRLLTFLEQTQDPLGKGYHIRQILFALGSGGIFGVGLGQSRQKYLFLPEAATDSIFAVIAEELGFVGALILIIFLLVFIYKALRIVANAPDKFSQVLSAGLITWIGGQIFLNIASMVALVPLTGIPLPFISYGGSSLVTVLVATGILLNISRYESKTK